MTAFRSPSARSSALIVGAVLAIVLVIVVGAALSPRAVACVPTVARDCGCHGDTTGTGMSVDVTEHHFSADGISSSYLLHDAGVDHSRPVGLLIRLHGDGAYEYDHSPTFLDCLSTVAAAHNLVMVTPRTPSPDLTWWSRLDGNVDWLARLHGEVARGVAGADTGRTWWMGYSGGAELLTYGLLPQRGQLVTAGAVMVGGGGAPDRQYGEIPVPDSVRSTLPLWWVTGARDDGTDPAAPFDALSAAAAGSRYYCERGFGGVVTDVGRDADHVSIDQVEILHEVLSGKPGLSSRTTPCVS